MTLQLPPLKTTKLISVAVHNAVVQVLRMASPLSCLYYAVAGSQLATEVIGREYGVQLGSLLLGTTKKNSAGETCKIYWNSKKEGAFALGSFHAWFICDDDKANVEIVDLSSRYYQLICDEHFKSNNEPSATVLFAPDPLWILSSNEAAMGSIRFEGDEELITNFAKEFYNSPMFSIATKVTSLAFKNYQRLSPHRKNQKGK